MCFPFPYRGKHIKITQIDLFLKFRDTYPGNLNQSNSPLADYQTGGSPLTFSVTPPENNSSTLTFNCDPTFQNTPHATVVDLSVKTSSTQWKMNISNSNNSPSNNQVGAIAGSLQVNVPPNAAQTYQILNPALIEDIFLVCHYSIS